MTLLTCFAITTGLIGFGGWYAWNIYNNTVNDWEKASEIQRLSREIIYMDEVLTMSARMGASTGDDFWEKRYYKSELKLRMLIEQAKGISPEKVFRRFIEQTENANNILVDMEVKAFSEVREDRMDKARAILFGQEYEEQKLIYSKGINDLTKEVARVNQKDINENARRLLVFSIVCVLALFVSWTVGLIVMARYVSQRRDAEEQALSESKFPSENPFPVLRISNEGKFLYLNKAAEILCLKHDCQIGHQIPELWKEILTEALSTQDCVSFEEEIEGKWFFINMVSISNEDYLNVYGLDITEKKNTEVSLKRYTQELNIKMKELEQSNQDLKGFASMTSHDLREPLRKIITFSGMLMETETQFDEKGQKYVEKILASGQRMNILIDDILSYSRLTKPDIKLDRIDLNDIISEVKKIVSLKLKETEGRVDFDELPIVRANWTQMVQLFQNLIINALEYKRDDTPPVIQLSSKVVDENFVEISVCDNGMGFDSQYADLIFKPFERLSSSKATNGTGLGLAICKKVVLNHGGEITVISQEKSGTTFFFILPKELKKL